MITESSNISHKEMYLKIFYLLVFLTVLTLLQPFIIGDSLQDTVLIQMFLAVIKSILIIAYYMHIKYESKFYKVIVLMAIMVLCIFFIITASDAIFRNESFDLFQ
jgi:cytochrome c oxidase subunit 4